MAKVLRGLPEGFSLELPAEPPVVLGDYLDEEPPPLRPKRQARGRLESAGAPPPESELRPEIFRTREERAGEKRLQPVPAGSQASGGIRYQLNLTVKSKSMLDELVKHVQTYSSQRDARTCEVFQGVMMLLHNAMDDLELADLPKRGAWGSVTAKNFPGALSEAFERAIIKSARKRGVAI